jgi:hypothetical protein
MPTVTQIEESLDVPVLLIVFNRPETTRRVFNAIRLARPRRLFVAADGPRMGINEEVRCEEVRKIATCVDWECDLRTLFSETNLGCGLGPSTAIDWFFKHVEEGIILEDDCLPNQSFFKFCAMMLEWYRESDHIWHVAGTSYSTSGNEDDYHFSAYPFIWGWATWRRVWKYYDFDMRKLDMDQLETNIDRIFLTDSERRYWKKHYRNIKNAIGDHWDYQWTATMWNHRGLAVLPKNNLVSNIGFGVDATHTTNNASNQANRKTIEVGSIRYRNAIHQDRRLDLFHSREIFGIESDWHRIRRISKHLLFKALSSIWRDEK